MPCKIMLTTHHSLTDRALIDKASTPANSDFEAEKSCGRCAFGDGKLYGHILWEGNLLGLAVLRTTLAVYQHS